MSGLKGVDVPSKRLPDWASLELSPSVESCGCGLGPREESGVLGFPSRRGLTPRGSLECNPEIPAFPGDAMERWGFCSSHYRAKETSSRRVSRT